jgi:hypothetical protein
MKLRIAAVLAGAALFSLPAAAQDTTGKDVVIKGKRITSEELAKSDPVLLMTKADGMAFMTGKKKPCTTGVLDVVFEADRFAADGASLDADALVESIRPRAAKKQVSCLRVTGPYDRATFDALGKALVEPLGVSLAWDKPAR